MSDDFVLDLAANPHPRMLAGALSARQRASDATAAGPDSYAAISARSWWAGYLNAMVDATGCTPADIEAWMDTHAVPEPGVNRTGA